LVFLIWVSGIRYQVSGIGYQVGWVCGFRVRRARRRHRAVAVWRTMGMVKKNLNMRMEVAISPRKSTRMMRRTASVVERVASCQRMAHSTRQETKGSWPK
jgi:hypothetical protein